MWIRQRFLFIVQCSLCFVVSQRAHTSTRCGTHAAAKSRRDSAGHIENVQHLRCSAVLAVDAAALVRQFTLKYMPTLNDVSCETCQLFELFNYAVVMELVDMQDLGSCVAKRVGSSPIDRMQRKPLRFQQTLISQGFLAL